MTCFSRINTKSARADFPAHPCAFAFDLLLCVVCVELNEALPLIRDFVFHEDRVYRAFRLAQAAVNTLVRVNVKLVSGFVDAVYRADGNTRFIFDADTRLGDYIRHGQVPPQF